MVVRRWKRVYSEWLAPATLSVLVTFFTAGCAHEPEPRAPIPAPSASRDEVIYAGTLVDLHLTGGFAGIDRHTWVSSDGRVHIDGGGPGAGDRELTPRQLSELTEAFAGWLTLADRYPPAPGTSDAIEYVVWYRGKRVTASDASDAPQAFWDAVHKLQRLADPPSFAPDTVGPSRLPQPQRK